MVEKHPEEELDMMAVEDEGNISTGPINIREAMEYMTTLNRIFQVSLREDHQDPLEIIVKSLKYHTSKMWPQMAAASVDVVLKTIKEPSCTTLQQSLESESVSTMDPEEDIPSG